MTVLKNILTWTAIGLCVVLGLLFALAILFGMATEVGVFPSTTVQTGRELPDKQYEALREANVLNRNEAVLYYYSEGLWDVTYGGSILTDRRILGYWTEEDKIKVYAYPVTDIDSITLLEEGGHISDAEYEVTSLRDEETSLFLYLSVEEDAHLPMVAAIETLVSQNAERATKETE